MILLSRRDLREIVAQAEQAYPDESCGLLVGHKTNTEYRITAVHGSTNMADRPRDRFEVDLTLIFQLQRELRTGPTELIGIYHSHPDHAAQPSARDLEQAWVSDLIWLITAVEDGQAIHTTGHRLVADGSHFEELTVHTDDWQPDPSRDPIARSRLP